MSDYPGLHSDVLADVISSTVGVLKSFLQAGKQAPLSAGKHLADIIFTKIAPKLYRGVSLA